MGFSSNLPLNNGGLYLFFSEIIAQNNFSYPTYIPFYTENGIPFAYPPLIFYILALISKMFHIPLLILSIYTPTIISILCLFAFYFLLKELFSEKSLILISTIIFALYLPLISYSAQGLFLVHGFGTLFFIIGLILVLRWMKFNNYKLIFFIGILFGLLILSSPRCAFAYALVLLTVVLLNPRKKTLFNLAFIVIIATLISSPWWVTVIQNHGINVLINGFMIRQPTAVFNVFISMYIYNIYNYQLSLMIICLLGLFYYIIKKEFFLPALFFLLVISGGYGVVTIPLILIIILFSVGLFKVIFPALKHILNMNTPIKTLLPLFFTILLLTLILGGSYIQNRDFFESRYSSLKDDEKVNFEAMYWINQSTENNSTFIVKDVIASEQKNRFWIGDWFPAITHRKTLNTFYGNEWTNKPQLWLADLELSNCKDTYCFENVSNKYSLEYTHVYIIKYPENGYVISSFVNSDDYMLIFENSKVVIFKQIISNF
ncbi:MAG: hypothetical protein WCB46_03665 [Methanoregula sp.]